MSTPTGADAPAPANGNSVVTYSPDDAVEPSAMSGPKPAAVHGLGQVLLTLIHRTNAFHSEDEQIAADNAVRAYVDAHVSNRDRQSFDPGDTRAEREDVSLRTPPGGAAPVVSGPVLDYQKLAQAILAAQKEQAQVTSGE